MMRSRNTHRSGSHKLTPSNPCVRKGNPSEAAVERMKPGHCHAEGGRRLDQEGKCMNRNSPPTWCQEQISTESLRAGVFIQSIQNGLKTLS